MAANPPDLRGGVFQQALIDGGVNPMAVSAATSAAFHCSTPRRWRGPVSYDYTSPQLRLVTPELRKYAFPNFDFHTTQGERRSARSSSPEEEIVPEPEPWNEPYSPRPASEPEQPIDGTGDGQYVAGRYIDIRNGVVSVNAARYGIAMLDSDRIVGGNFTIKSDSKLLRVTKGGDYIDREWTLNLNGTQSISVITGIEIDEAGHCLKLTKQNITAWVDGAPEEDYSLVFERIEPVTSGQLDAGELTFEGPVVYYLGNTPTPPGPVFNIPVADCTP
jgi:hypothetical protein